MKRAGADSIVAAFSEEQAERLTGVSRRQLRYWAKDFFVPTLKVDSSSLSDLRLYSFRDLVCLKVLNALRNEVKVSLQELRKTKERLSHLGEDLWATSTLYVFGKRVVIENPDTGEKEEAVSRQGVLQIPLRVVSEQVAGAVQAMRGRRGPTIGKIEQKRGVAQNQPVIAGTRIPVRSIQAFSKAGYSTEEINRQYPTLARDDIEAAVRYKAVA